MSLPESRFEPPPATLDAARRWLAPVRAALGAEFLAAYVTGSALTEGFDPARSNLNLLVLVRALPPSALDPLAAAIPPPGRGPHVAPLFLGREQLRDSLDVFPIEWLDLLERHLLLEGEDVLAGVEVPRTYLRLQCEQELRGKHLRLRQEYLGAAGHPQRLREALVRLASGFHTLFRTLLRLQGETPPARTERVIERLADVYHLDATALLGAHLLRVAPRPHAADETRDLYRRFLAEIERLVAAIDGLRVS